MSKEQQICFLKKWRFGILDELHVRQPLLDRLDYILLYDEAGRIAIQKTGRPSGRQYESTKKGQSQ